MAKFKVWLTVKDRYGNTKEVDGGNISVDTDLEAFPEKVIDVVENALPFDEYLKIEDIDTKLGHYATDVEAQEVAAAEAEARQDTIKYSTLPKKPKT